MEERVDEQRLPFEVQITLIRQRGHAHDDVWKLLLDVDEIDGEANPELLAENAPNDLLMWQEGYNL